MKSPCLFSVLCFFSISSFAQNYVVAPLLNKFTKLNTVRKLATDYFNKPLMVMLSYHEKVSDEKKKSLFKAVKEIGFTDSVIMVLLPQYPGTKLKDSIKQVCSDRHIGSVLQMNFIESSDESFMRTYMNNPIKSGMNIIVNYMGWIPDQKQYIEPCLTLYYHINEPLKEKFLNALPGQ